MKKIIKLLVCILLVFGLTMGSITASAESFQEKNGQGKTVLVPQKDVFAGELYIRGSDYGIGEFASISDLCVQGDKIYILDGGNSRIVVLDKNYKFLSVIESVVNGEEEVDLSTATGLYVSKTGTMYIADSENQYVLVVDDKGKVKKVITKPDSPIIPDNLEFFHRYP